MCFLVAALTHLLSREKGATASAIVDALVQLGNGSGASLPGWASGGDRDAVMLGLFNLFDTPSAGPTALDVFNDHTGSNPWFDLASRNAALPVGRFCITQCVAAVRALHIYSGFGSVHCIEHAVTLLHDLDRCEDHSTLDLEDYAFVMRCLLESDVHRAKEDLVIKVLGTLHEGSIPFEPADDQVAGWIRLAFSTRSS